MSPVNSDDSSGAAFGTGRPLTRKEMRAQEKVQAPEGHNVVPPQAFETGEETPAAAPGADNRSVPETGDDAVGNRGPSQADEAPEPPAAAPTVHELPVDPEVPEVPVEHVHPVDRPGGPPWSQVHVEPVHGRSPWSMSIPWIRRFPWSMSIPWSLYTSTPGRWPMRTPSTMIPTFIPATNRTLTE